MKNEIHISGLGEDELAKVASEFAEKLKPGDITVLKGEMGSGKTFFVRAACEVFGCSSAVHSPSFKLINIYKGKNFQVYHMDFYRLNSVEEILDLGVEEILDREAVFFIEYPRGFEEKLKDFYSVEFEIAPDGKRNLTIRRVVV